MNDERTAGFLQLRTNKSLVIFSANIVLPQSHKHQQVSLICLVTNSAHFLSTWLPPCEQICSYRFFCQFFPFVLSFTFTFPPLVVLKFWEGKLFIISNEYWIVGFYLKFCTHDVVLEKRRKKVWVERGRKRKLSLQSSQWIYFWTFCNVERIKKGERGKRS